MTREAIHREGRNAGLGADACGGPLGVGAIIPGTCTDLELAVFEGEQKGVGEPVELLAQLHKHCLGAGVGAEGAKLYVERARRWRG